MPTLLEINVASNYGSTGKIAEQLGLLAQQKGWDVYVAHGARYINPSVLNTIQIENKLGERMHGLFYSLLFDKHGLGSVTATKKFIKKIKTEIKPDLIHLHNIHGYYLNYKLLFEYLSQSNIPLVWTFHDCWPFTGHCAHFSEKNCYKWKKQCYDCECLKSYPRSLFYDRSRKNYIEKKYYFNSVRNMTIVPVSKWLSGMVEQSFFNTFSIHVIYNGVDLNDFNFVKNTDYIKKYGLNEKKYILGVAAPWSPNKGLADFIKLRKVLPKEYNIVLVGLTRKQISDLPLGIIGIERTQNVKELAAFYSNANVFLNLSRQETFGMTTAESISCGTPVIVYNVTACPEPVSKDTGRVVPVGDIQKVVNAIMELEGLDRLELRNKCRNYAEKYFDKQKCFQQYIDLYNEILKTK